MTRQINVVFEEHQVRGLDRIATKLAIARPELMRRLVDEAIAADLAGRELFTAEVEELSPTDVRYLVEESKKLHTSLDRTQRQNDKREEQLLKREEALATLMATLDAERAAAMEAAGLNVERRLERAIEKAVEPGLGLVRSDLRELKDDAASLKRHAQVPRTAYGLIFRDGGVWSMAFITLWSAMMFALGVMFMAPLAYTFPGVGVPVANRLLDGDADFCRLVEQRFNRTDCQVPRGRRLSAEPAAEPVKAAARE